MEDPGREGRAVGVRRPIASLLLVLLCAAGDAGAEDAAFAPAADAGPTPYQERRLVQSLFDVQQGRIDDALRNLGLLIRQQPDFRLAHLVFGDLMLAQAAPLAALGNRTGGAELENLRAEARARFLRYRGSPPATAVPSSLLRLPPEAQAAMVVDLRNYRLFLFENRNERLVRTRDFYVSIGKGGSQKLREGDEKTPVGVYLVSSYLPGRELPDLYGVGAYPINYPNGWDRIRGRSGSGIWIHGTESETYSRPPQSSRGCVTLSNQDFKALQGHVRIRHTPVVVTDEVEWVPEEEVAARRRELEEALDRWRRDWESLDTESYLRNYSPAFRTAGMDRSSFAAYKRQVNSTKKFIRVRTDSVGIYLYPGEADLALLDFRQLYESDNFRGQRRKHQYWRREGGSWRIVFEESV